MPIPLGILAVAGAGAAGGAGYELIQTTVLGSNTATVTFSNINTYTQYEHLQLRITARSDRNSDQDTLNIRLNNDSSTTYRTHILKGTGSAVESTTETFTGSFLALKIPDATQGANIYAAAVIDLLDFSNASKNTTMRLFGGYDNTAFVGLPEDIVLKSGLYPSAAAITQISFLSATGSNFVAGSRFSLYGIK